MADRIRVVIGTVVTATPGPDGRDREGELIARALRDAGMEVVYTGAYETPEQLVQTVIQEDADALGLANVSGAHLSLFGAIADQLRDKGAEDVVLFGSGTVAEGDLPVPERVGGVKVFAPGAAMEEIVAWVRATVGAE